MRTTNPMTFETTRRLRLAPMVLATLLAAGCGTLGPKGEKTTPRERAQPTIAAAIPVAVAPHRTAAASAPATLAVAPRPDQPPPAVAPSWRDFVQDEPLRALVEAALAHNRDLRVAAATVARARTAVDGARAAHLPQVGVGLGAQRAPNFMGDQSNTLTAGVQLASWEIDLFGRLDAADEAARAQLAGSEAGQRATEIAVISQVLATALAERADARQVELARQTLASRQEALRLVTLREKAGYSSMIDLDSQRALVAQTRSSLAQAERQWAQDRQALALLVGRPMEAVAPAPGASAPALAALPTGKALDDAILRPIAGDIDSSALWFRPDVIQAETALAAADANVRAARAALWPSLTLTGQAGQASATLAGLFRGGHFAYTLAANAALSIFDGGRRKAGIASAEATQQAALAQYEKAIQSAFKEAADALVAAQTWREQAAALQEQAVAARGVARLTDLKTRQGASSLLEQLEAQRQLFAAEQALLQARQAELSARVAVWKALGR